MKKKEKYTDKFVGITPKEYKELGDRHKKVLEIFSRHKFDKILDVGCGDGNFTKLIAKACRAKEVYGIDVSERAIKIAKNNGIKAFKVDVDEENLPFRDNYFDAVYAGAIIEHLFDPDHFLDEIYRVLKPGGLLVLDTPNLASLYNRLALLLGYQPFDMHVSIRYPIGHLYDGLYEQESRSYGYIRGSDHIRLFTYRSLLLILKKHNFTILKVYGASDVVHTKSSIILSLVRIIDCIIRHIPSLSRNVVVLAQKRD